MIPVVTVSFQNKKGNIRNMKPQASAASLKGVQLQVVAQYSHHDELTTRRHHGQAAHLGAGSFGTQPALGLKRLKGHLTPKCYKYKGLHGESAQRANLIQSASEPALCSSQTPGHHQNPKKHLEPGNTNMQPSNPHGLHLAFGAAFSSGSPRHNDAHVEVALLALGEVRHLAEHLGTVKYPRPCSTLARESGSAREPAGCRPTEA